MFDDVAGVATPGLVALLLAILDAGSLEVVEA